MRRGFRRHVAECVLALFWPLSFVSPLGASSEMVVPGDLRVLPRAQFTASYHWEATTLEGGSQLLTLFGRFGSTVPPEGTVPLVAILRDRIAGNDPGTGRLRYIWLLTASRPGLGQLLLSAVPFFYWTVGSESNDRSAGNTKPLLDLSSPTPRVWKTAARYVLQWTVLDPMTMPVRASTRAFRTNGSDRERLHVEEAIAFLRNAPTTGDGSGLSQSELNSALARLNLTKNLLGGLMTENGLERVTAARDAARSQSVGRNWELLRNSAERAGLIFEPLSLVNTAEEYAVLWFPVGTAFAAPGVSLDSTWKLLHISDPWTDPRLTKWKGYSEMRWFDENSRLLPYGAIGTKQVKFAPLAVYSLTYARAPLLMVDFRNGLQTRRREVIQRASEEIVSGVLGLSHFANWYYYAGNGAYQFVKARRGSAEDRALRLDSYSEFRVALALTASISPSFQHELQRRVKALAMNPLETTADQDISSAWQHYHALHQNAASIDGLPLRVNRDRRRELASFGQGYPGTIWASMLHYASFGTYTQAVPQEAGNLELLSANRRIEALIRYLDRVAASGPQVEISYPAEQIRRSVNELVSATSEDVPPKVRREVLRAIAGVQAQTRSEAIIADCNRALALLNAPQQQVSSIPTDAFSFESSALPEADRSIKTE